MAALNSLYAVKVLTCLRNLRESLAALIGRLIHDKPRVPTAERGSARLKNLTQVRAALGEAEARSEERRLALESHIQDVGFMRIQLRVRNARIAALEKEVSDSGGAPPAQRKEQAATDEAAVLNETIATLTATLAERDASIAALKAMRQAEGETLAARQSEFARALAETEGQRKTLEALETALAAANRRLTEEKAAALAALELRNSMEAEIGAQRQRVAQLEAELEGVVRKRDARIVALEKKVSDLGVALAQHKERAATSEAAGLNETIATLTATLAERDASIAALKAMQQAEGETLAARQGEFARARAESEFKRKTLGALKAALAAANKRLAEEKAAALAALELRNSMDAEIGAQRQRVGQLEVELAGVERARDAHIAAAAAVQAEHIEQSERLATATARVLELEAEARDRVHVITPLQEELRVSSESARNPERDLQAAADSVHQLQADLGGKNSGLHEMAKMDEDSPGTSATHEVSPERVAPHFIRTGESEVVHVLGSKTTIGRTADNDLQIDAQYISRHHAIILAGRTHTIIEDLNSTNGVIVNGRRVQRQTLKDGDIVLIGKAPFRFAVRPVTEPR